MLIPIHEFWIPILLATVLTFIAGSLLHMVVPIHKRDWGTLPDEDALLAAMRKAGVQPGNYMFPHPPSMQAMNEPGFVKKMEEGPCGTMTVRGAGRIAMGPYLLRQFVWHLLVSAVIAYVVGIVLGHDVAYLHAFRVVCTVAILAYVAAIFPEAIWYSHPGNYVRGKVIDGVVWGLLTAGCFAGFWPR